MAFSAPLKILIVDDNEESAKTMCWMMELEGHQACMALDGPSGITLAREFKPHVVLLDIGMPVMNGYEVCAAMQKDPAFKETLFIAQTGWGQPEHRQRSKESGFDHHLVKPVLMKDLQKILRSLQARLSLGAA